ncbi:DNA-binding response regulator [Lachnoclostridium sp. An169]|uniref:response regulator transcription factor n=1 Tax=Lachnoclostridium sp. An169 TaxID=1965569 RepID=UPI000B38657F|nr:response regulator transcription factor [Lachnoclostridium sp. An169]OUP80047.1 DNA-binding response regulator [Lachnoclostridium sp. An169]
MAHHILIIEDDADINGLLKCILEEADCETGQAFSGTEAAFYVERKMPDLILLDLMLPGMSGERFLEELREKDAAVPVIVLSAKSALKDKVALLKLGADDYITKPFEPEEVAARVEAALRRSGISSIRNSGRDGNEESRDGTGKVYSYKNLVLDPELRKVTILGRETELTGKEFEIMKLLLAAPEKVYSRESLYEQVWKDGYYGTDHTVNVHVSNLRRKIREEDPQEEYIQSVYGIGFRLARI